MVFATGTCAMLHKTAASAHSGNTSIDLLNLNMYNGTIIIVFAIYLCTKKTIQSWTTSLHFDLTFCQAGSIVVSHGLILPDK